MERLERISWPKPLAELLETTFTTYRAHHPWLTTDPAPKSIVREMLESGDSFATFVRRYRLERSEGLVLRYLTDAWRALDRSLPDDVYTDALGGRRGVARRADPGHRRHAARRVDAPRRASRPRPPRARRARRRAGRSRRRRGARRCAPPRSGGWSCWPHARTPPWPSAAGGPRTTCGWRWRRTGWSTTASASTPRPGRRRSSTSPRNPTAGSSRSVSLDPAGDGEWHLVATVDLEVARAEGAPTLQLDVDRAVLRTGPSAAGPASRRGGR